MKEFDMEKITPELEKSPSAKMMSAREMAEFAGTLIRLKNEGYGDSTVNDLVADLDQEIKLKLGKKSPEEIEAELFGDSQ
ncbi:MAG: hypothetical protein Q8O32_01670 [bacterium]|nr:hypothetical protein [bacterium]